MVIMISFVPGRWMRFETSEWSELKVPYSFVLTLLVSGPRFAIESLPRRSCLLSGWNLYVNTNKRLRMQSWPVERTIERNRASNKTFRAYSSGKVTSSPQIDDFFPVTWAVSPPWIMNPRMFRWNIVLSYLPAAAKARKLKAVRGHVSQKISHFKSPAVVWIVTDMVEV